MTINTKTYYVSNDFIIRDDAKGRPYVHLRVEGVPLAKVQRAAALSNLALKRRSKRGIELERMMAKGAK